MKTLILATVSLFALPSIAGPIYQCVTNADSPTTKVEIRSKTQALLNDADVAKIDRTYAKKHPAKSYYKMNGFFKTLGDGAEGYSVSLVIAKSMFEGSNTGFMSTIASGPDGAYQISYRCARR